MLSADEHLARGIRRLTSREGSVLNSLCTRTSQHPNGLRRLRRSDTNRTPAAASVRRCDQRHGNADTLSVQCILSASSHRRRDRGLSPAPRIGSTAGACSTSLIGPRCHLGGRALLSEAVSSMSRRPLTCLVEIATAGRRRRCGSPQLQLSSWRAQPCARGTALIDVGVRIRRVAASQRRALTPNIDQHACRVTQTDVVCGARGLTLGVGSRGSVAGGWCERLVARAGVIERR